MATVTPWRICLGSINRVLRPASSAAGSATAGRSTFSSNEGGMLEGPGRVPDFFRRDQSQRQAQLPGGFRSVPARRP